MSNRLLFILLVIIALLLSAIVAKLYLPWAQQFGAQISPPTYGEIVAASKIGDPLLRRARIEELHNRAAIVWVRGGDVEVSGNVDVSGSTVEASIVR